jgi:uncharacterized protein YcfL
MKSVVAPTVMTVSLALGCAMFAGGCDTVHAPSTPTLDKLPAQAYPKVAVLDGELARALAIDPSMVVVTPTDGNNPMSVSVPIRSLVDNTMRMEHCFIWFDAQGREVRRTVWKRQDIDPRVQIKLQSNAIDTRSVDWRLEIRSAF